MQALNGRHVIARRNASGQINASDEKPSKGGINYFTLSGLGTDDDSLAWGVAPSY
jgi:hypothetical protein